MLVVITRMIILGKGGEQRWIIKVLHLRMVCGSRRCRRWYHGRSETVVNLRQGKAQSHSQSDEQPLSPRRLVPFDQKGRHGRIVIVE